MKSLAIWAINLYQKYVSPYKGYRCAYGVYHQNGTCSSIIKGHIQKEGLIKAYPLIRGQFQACKFAYDNLERKEQRRHKKEEKRKNKEDKRKRKGTEVKKKDDGGGCSGDCSGCSSMDLDVCDCDGGSCDIGSC